MKKYYTTGQFAKKAGTTERRIRYYDTIGILKPTHILDNGYRQYSHEDLIKLQKIIALQQLGFSLEEIFPMIVNTDTVESSFKESIEMQIDIINKKIHHLEGLKEALIKTNSLLQQGEVQWNRIAELIKLSHEERTIIKQYHSSSSLLKRIRMQETFSTNNTPWFTWVYQQMEVSKANKLLEVGCGNGFLWKQNNVNLRHREFFLTDSNKHMLEETKNNLHEDFNYMMMDCENITFKKEYFDMVIANHVLYYLNTIEKGIEEIQRVLKPYGVFYCTAYGKDHMHEINLLVKEYHPKIQLMETNMYKKFNIENGKQILKSYFQEIEVRAYHDVLHINQEQMLIDYIMSCPGNQNEIIGKDIHKFKRFIANKIKEKGYINTVYNAYIFICKK